MKCPMFFFPLDQQAAAPQTPAIPVRKAEPSPTTCRSLVLYNTLGNNTWEMVNKMD